MSSEESDYEESFSKTATVRSYSDNPDNVKFGRGNDIFPLRGNVLYRQVIKANQDAYQRAKTNKEKALVAKDIVLSYKAQGRAFFHKVDEEWVECTFGVTLAKVKQALREKPKETSSLSSTTSTPVVSPTNYYKKQALREKPKERSSLSSTTSIPVVSPTNYCKC